MSDPTITPTGKRGGKPDRDERISVLDPTPPPLGIDATQARTGGVGIEGAPGQLAVSKPSADVVRSAVERVTRDEPAREREEEKPRVEYFRYVGDGPRKFTMPAGPGRDGYSATMKPGKVIDSVQYSIPALKSQGFLPGRNLERISEEEAKAS